MRISDWSSDVCSSDLAAPLVLLPIALRLAQPPPFSARTGDARLVEKEEHTLERLCPFRPCAVRHQQVARPVQRLGARAEQDRLRRLITPARDAVRAAGGRPIAPELLRPEEHPPELQSLMR